MDQTDSRLVFVPESEAITQKDGSTAYVNRYWIYHSNSIVFYRQSPKSKYLFPQCTTNEIVATSIKTRLYPWAEIKFIPVVCIEERD